MTSLWIASPRRKKHAPLFVEPKDHKERDIDMLFKFFHTAPVFVIQNPKHVFFSFENSAISQFSLPFGLTSHLSIGSRRWPIMKRALRVESWSQRPAADELKLVFFSQTQTQCILEADLERS